MITELMRMKKLFLMVVVALLAVAATSCKKDKDGGMSSMGTFAEGIYKPDFRILSVKEGQYPVRTFSWGSSKLASITTDEGHVYQFNYSGDMLGNVTISGANQQINYTYGGSMLTKVEIVNGTRKDVVMNINHNANDQISSVNLELSDAFLIALATQYMFGTKDLARMIGPKAFGALVEASRAMQRKGNDAKYNISNKQFTITYTWNGANLVTENISGNVTATATISDVSDALNMGAIASIINMIGSDTEFPLSATINITTNYTYDNMNNPEYCLWADGISASNLSQNNILSSVTTGGADVTFTVVVPEGIPMVGGMEYPMSRNIDMGGQSVISYTYNKKNLPETYAVDGKTYTYIYE